MKVIDVYKRVPLIFLKLSMLIIATILILVLVVLSLPLLWNTKCRKLVENASSIVEVVYEM